MIIEEKIANIPYCWMVSGSSRGYFGEYAEDDARSEARRCGGTTQAFPLFTEYNKL